MGGMFMGLLSGIGARAQEVNDQNARAEQEKRKTLAETYLAIASMPGARPEMAQAALEAAMTIQQTPYDKKLPKNVTDLGEVIASLPTPNYPVHKPAGTGLIDASSGGPMADPTFAGSVSTSVQRGQNQSPMFISPEEESAARMQDLRRELEMRQQVEEEGEANKYNRTQNQLRAERARLGVTQSQEQFKEGYLQPPVVVGEGSMVFGLPESMGGDDKGQFTNPAPPSEADSKRARSYQLYASQHDLDPGLLNDMQKAEAEALYNKVIAGRGSVIPVMGTDDGTPTGNPVVRYLYQDEARDEMWYQRLPAGEIAKAGSGDKLQTLIKQIRQLAVGTDPVTGEIVEGAEGIFDKQGVLARLDGWWKVGLGYWNKAPAVTEYNALLTGFAPILARSIGHTGVLTQIDVESVVALFPQLGESREIATNKLANVKLIMETGDLPFSLGQAGDPAYYLAPDGVNYFMDGGRWYEVH